MSVTARKDWNPCRDFLWSRPRLVRGTDPSLQGSDVNHIKNVLRMKPEEEIWISNGDKDGIHTVRLKP